MSRVQILSSLPITSPMGSNEGSIEIDSNWTKFRVSFFYMHAVQKSSSPLNEKLSLRPDQERRQGQADAALPHLPEWNEYLLRLVEKGKSPAGNWTVTLLNHYMTEKSIL